ncbi:MAG: peptidylprolyl isomerase [Proteobacteria bacterium]|nr:peptidylprolyl isomerase [Pseudomonadota bacterium]
MKKILKTYSMLAVALLMISACTPKKTEQQGKTMPSTEGKTAELKTSMGDITIEFYPDVAPNHVENFKKLARSGFYDGTTFHRVIPGFMIQGGDPNSKSDNRGMHGTGGPGYTVDAEFSDIKHERGIVSMARSSDPNSAGSQFFIVVRDSSHLDRQYTVFGKVTSGLNVVDQIVSVPRDPRDNPIKKVTIDKVTIK